MRRILLAAMLTMALALFLIPCISYGGETVNVNGISKPVTGAAAPDSATVSGYDVVSVEWYDLYNDEYCGSKFEAMSEYTLYLTLKRTDGSNWTDSNIPDDFKIADKSFDPTGEGYCTYTINKNDKTKCKFEFPFDRTDPEKGKVYVFSTYDDTTVYGDSLAVRHAMDCGELPYDPVIFAASPYADDESYIAYYAWYLPDEEGQEEGPDEILLCKGNVLDIQSEEILSKLSPGHNLVRCDAYSRKYSSPISVFVDLNCYDNMEFYGKVKYKNKLVYNGKSGRTPAITVKDTLRNWTLSEGVDYKISYNKTAKYRKNVGSYYFYITNLSYFPWYDSDIDIIRDSSFNYYYTIVPKSTTIKSITSSNRKATVKWAKKTTQVTGYQVRYSKSKTFSSYKTKTIKKNTITSTTIKKLTKGKTYYFKVRTYKTVKGTKYYSDWSQVKSKKIR